MPIILWREYKSNNKIMHLNDIKWYKKIILKTQKAAKGQP